MQLDLRTIQHINFVVPNYPEVQEHFFRKYGAILNWELLPPNRPDNVRASLITIGPQLFEVFGPHAGSRNGIARIQDAKGPGFIGIEFGVGDLDQARQAFKDHGIRMRYEPKKKYYPGTWFVSEPDDLFGLAMECYVGDWYVEELPPGMPMKPVAPRSFWTDEHPLGIVGLRHVIVAVNDVATSVARWESLTGAKAPNLDSYRPGSIYREMANTSIEFVGTESDSDVAAHVQRRGEGIYGVAFNVRDVDQVIDHLASGGVATERLATDAIVSPASENHGVRLEFVSEVG